MPIPLLPLELIRLIAEYVVDDLDEHAGRAECFRLARVCKAWGALVEPLAWRTLTVDPGIDIRPLDYVLTHPEVLRIVEVVDARCLRLSVNNKVAVGEISEYHAAKLVTLLRSCTSLTNLKLAPCAAPFRLLAATSVLPLASSLKTLALAFDVDVFHCDFLVSCLARFAGLRTLHLFIECDETREAVIKSSPIISTIDLRELKFSLRSSADLEGLLFSLTSRINPFTLYRCALLDFCGSSILFNWLGKCQWLYILEITAFDEETLDDLLEDVCRLLPSLVSLLSLNLYPFDMSPCSLSSSRQSERPWSLLLDTLAAMSAPLFCRVGGLFFEASSAAYPVRCDPDGDPVDLMTRAITLIAFAWTDDEDDDWFVDLEDEYSGVKVQLYYMPDEGGTGHKRWYRVSLPVDDADDD
ncbi:hypothetical protein Rhopal_005467-T1 [Rhodotorula paludigena]|uniref:F-box domain-containing protein n=1 Tax=Rhodotorula paludigena TaxID=86838 RepID=A0AAV5GTS0_9BASI|nr:hypothetical protein Rhopal_005467-T1 [Rhodotorula paludigena]